MGSLDNPKLRDVHEQIQKAIFWSSTPNFQKVCEILNGMTMEDMLDELWRIQGTGNLERLAAFAPSATGVDNDRLRAALGAIQDQPPPNLDALVRRLPLDQQRAIKNVRAVTQAPDSLSPTIWSQFYWQTRLLPTYVPPPAPSTTKGNAGQAAGNGDDEAHLAADIATALTANAPPGANSTTYTVTVVYRNLDLFTFGSKQNEVAVVHEPNVSVQISPDPNSPAALQAAVTLINVHLKRHWGMIKPDIELSVAGQAGVQSPSGAPSGGVQAQVEIHVTTKVSLTLGASLGFGAPPKAGDPPDRGAFHFGNRDVDMAFTPFSIGILGHWDPPTK